MAINQIGEMDYSMAGALASWTAPALWRFGVASHAVEKRQRTAALQTSRIFYAAFHVASL
jgi:hypothetical protein